MIGATGYTAIFVVLCTYKGGNAYCLLIGRDEDTFCHHVLTNQMTLYICSDLCTQSNKDGHVSGCIHHTNTITLY